MAVTSATDELGGKGTEVAKDVWPAAIDPDWVLGRGVVTGVVSYLDGHQHRERAVAAHGTFTLAGLGSVS